LPADHSCGDRWNKSGEAVALELREQPIIDGLMLAYLTVTAMAVGLFAGWAGVETLV